MPTENRSSNTESKIQPLAQHPEGRRERFQKWVLATKHPVLGYLDGTWLARGDDREGYADKYVQGLWVAYKEFGQPAPHPHPDPIAWMVGTAFWWTKEEAERDAAETGLPIVELGPMAGVAQALHQGEPVAVLYANGTVLTKADCGDVFDICCKVETPLYTHADPAEVERLRASVAELRKSLKEQNRVEFQNGKLRAQLDTCNDARQTLSAQLRAAHDKLAEAHALLRRAANYATRMEPMPAKLLNQIDDALSASAEPSALPDPLGCNECTHAECGRFDGPRQVECRAMADNACARPGASS